MFFLGSYGDQNEERVLAGQGGVAREVSDVKKLPEKAIDGEGARRILA